MTKERKRGVAVLFDLDGVIIDSESQYTRFWQSIDRLYPTGVEDFAIAIKGNTLTRILEWFSGEETKTDVTRRIHEFEGDMVYPVYPGVREFIAELHNLNIPIAIVTSSDDVKMDRLYRQQPWIREEFDTIINGSIVTRSKPDPQGYLMAADALGENPEDCYVFEDSLQGLEAGRRSGATVIGVATTYPAEQLEGKADLLITSFEGFTAKKMMETSKQS